MKKVIKFVSVIICLFISVTILKIFVLNPDYSAQNLVVADFRFDINLLTDVAMVTEGTRGMPNSKFNTPYGTDNKVLKYSNINKDLLNALVKIADANGDRKISEDEITGLELRKLNPAIYKDEMSREGIQAIFSDSNIENFIIITKGPYTGTILYNGRTQFIDSNKQRYFGLELYKEL